MESGRNRRQRQKRGAGWTTDQFHLNEGNPNINAQMRGRGGMHIHAPITTNIRGSSVPELPVTDQIKIEARKHIEKPGLPPLKTRKQKRLQKQRQFDKVSMFPRHDGSQISDGGRDDVAVTEQIKQEAAKHLDAQGFPNKRKGKNKKLRKMQRLRKQKKFVEIANFPNAGGQISDIGRADLAVTEQIKQEAAKHLDVHGLPNKLKGKNKKWRKMQRLNKQKKFATTANFPVDSGQIFVSDGGGADLAVTDQIRQEAAKHLDAQGFPHKFKGKNKKSRKRQRMREQKILKRIENFLNDGGQISDTGGVDLAVTDQIKQEAAKHLHAQGLPNRKLKRKGRQMRKMQILQKSERFPSNGVQISDVGGPDPAVTEQIKQEAAKHLDAQGFPDKRKGKHKQWRRMRKLKRQKQIDRLENLHKERVQISDGSVADLIAIQTQQESTDVGVPWKLRKNDRQQRRRERKQKKFIKRMRSGNKPKVRPARKFIDVSLVGNTGNNEASTGRTSLPQQPERTQTELAKPSHIETIPGLGDIHWSSHNDGIAPFVFH